MEVNIDNVIVGGRKRQLDMEKVATLASSIHEIGLLNPITIRSVNNHYELVAGAHRLEACRLLQLTTIRAELFEGDDLGAELAEIDENLRRNDLTVLEQGEHLLRRNEILDELGLRAEVGQGRPKNGAHCAPLFEEDDRRIDHNLKTTEDIAGEVGLKVRAAQQRLQIARNITPEVRDAIRFTEIADNKTQLLELARMQPEEQQRVAEVVTKIGAQSLSDIRNEMRRAMHAEKRNQVFPTGKYSVILADPPWSYDNSGFEEAADNQYPTMELQDICELPVADLATNTTVLFLWATNPLLPEALQVMSSWGFQYKTNMAWVKDAGRGKGWFLKSKHELLLIGVQSATPHPAFRPDSCFEADRGQVHSRKPAIAYEIIEAMYPGSKIELFARAEREGWTIWGNES